MNSDIKEKLHNLASLVGNTPLLEIALTCHSEERRVYVKLEYLNLTGSIKDRMALHILRDAYEKGILREGKRIVEATSGNTGIAFAAAGAYLGNPVTIFMPDWMSQERIDLIRSFGAEIRPVSEKEGGFLGAIEMAERMGKEEDVFLPRQFSNPQNVKAHCLTTGKEIIEQMTCWGQRPAGVVAGIGTGGTLMGIRKALLDLWSDCRFYPLDPANSSPLATGGKAGGKHRIAGIGDEFIPEIVKLDQLDEIILIDDGDAINMARMLASGLGLGVGISSGANFLGALKVQEILQDPKAAVITIFADDNKKYLTTDLMKEQLGKPEHLTPYIKLCGFRVLPMYRKISQY